jgi:hypothetical protein
VPLDPLSLDPFAEPACPAELASTLTPVLASLLASPPFVVEPVFSFELQASDNSTTQTPCPHFMSRTLGWTRKLSNSEKRWKY